MTFAIIYAGLRYSFGKEVQWTRMNVLNRIQIVVLAAQCSALESVLWM